MNPGLAVLGPGLLDVGDPGLLFWEGPVLFGLHLLKDILNPAVLHLQTQPLSDKAKVSKDFLSVVTKQNYDATPASQVTSPLAG